MSIQSALVVDDSKVAHIKLRKLLEKRSIAVEWVNSGEKAITALKDTTPDVVFMDIMMPGIDGFETTKAVLANPVNANIAVVMCSGNDSAEDREKANSIGAAGYIRKPYSDADLDQILSDVDARADSLRPAEPEVAATAPSADTGAAAAAIDMADIISQATAAGTRAAEEAFNRLSVLMKDEVATIANAAAKEAAHEVADEADAGLSRAEVESIAAAAAERVVGPRIDQALASMPQPAHGLDASAVTTAIRHFVTSKDFKRQVASVAPVPKLDQAEVARIADSTAREVAKQAADGVTRSASDMARKVAEETARRAAQEASSGGNAAIDDAIKSAVGGLKTGNVILTIGLIGVIAYLALTHLQII